MSLCSPQTRMFADEVLAAYRSRRQIGPLTSLEPTFSVADGEKVGHEVARRRVAAGERIIGRKIGFTNRTIWAEYGVYSPIWGPVYDTTFRDVDGPTTVAIGHLVEPRIEPEIVLGFKAPVTAGMDERAILGAVGWVAHGFEIVQSLFPGWRFQGADCQAPSACTARCSAGRGRGRGRCGGLAEGADDLLDHALSQWRAHRPGRRRQCAGRPALGGAAPGRRAGGRPAGEPIAAGEIITTGTVTRAFPVAAGETWSTEVEGLAVKPMSLTFG